MTEVEKVGTGDVEVLDLYDRLMFTGSQTIEKHVRWSAAKIVEGVQDGFATPRGGTTTEVQFRVLQRDVIVEVFVPAGCHGFALQMAVEEQIRQAVRP